MMFVGMMPTYSYNVEWEYVRICLTNLSLFNSKKSIFQCLAQILNLLT